MSAANSATSSATFTRGLPASGSASRGTRPRGRDGSWLGHGPRSEPGDISYVKASGGQFRARTRFRDDDGKVRRVSATGTTKREAERNLKKIVAGRSSYRSAGELTGDSTFTRLVDVWLADLDLEAKVAPSTRALYERNMRQLVIPVFEGYSLREINVSKVDQFIKRLATAKSYSMAKRARTVLSLAFGLAVRYDAIQKNPVRDTTRLRKPPSQAMALTVGQVDAIRAAVRSWRRGPGFAGPPPGRRWSRPPVRNQLPWLLPPDQ